MARMTDSQVRRRANDRCEYCRLVQQFSPLKFQIDHIIARQHGGEDGDSNLALACMFCNAHKGPNISGIDSNTGKLTRLYNPRADRWLDHFATNGSQIAGVTDVGRVTIAVLSINHQTQIALRRSMLDEGYSFSEW